MTPRQNKIKRERARRRRRAKERGQVESARPPKCDYCGGEPVIVRSEQIYARPKIKCWMWICENYPNCDARVGCHPKSKRSLGKMADAATRKARMKCHNHIDGMWKSGKYKRKQLYSEPAHRLRISQHDCHIGHFTKEMAERALAVIIDIEKNGIEQRESFSTLEYLREKNECMSDDNF